MSRLSGALALLHQRPSGAVVVLRLTPAVERAHVAALLCTAFRHEGSAHVEAIHRAADDLDRDLPVAHGWSNATLERHEREARVLRARIVALGADAVAVGIAVARRLLEDAPDACADLDRAVRDAALAHDHAVTEAHERAAERALEG